MLCFNKDDQTFLFRYAAGSEDAVIDAVMDCAEAKDCPLDWLDAATISFQIAQYAAGGADQTAQAGPRHST